MERVTGAGGGVALESGGRGEGAMAWHGAIRAVGRYREWALAAAFIGMAGWELLEMLVLEPPRGTWLSLPLLVHSVQVGIVLVATHAVMLAWREKTAYAESLGRMVEQVVFAQEEERRRIAYELHDGIAQLIVSAKQHVDTCEDVWHQDPSRAAAELARGIDRLKRAIVETRRVLMALRPSMVDGVGLGPAARRSVEEVAQEAGWTLTFAEDLGEGRLPSAVETAAFWILQEALANAWRHARTRRVDVELRRDGGWLLLEVRDSGVGFASTGAEPGSRGLGLRSMRERARLLGGQCLIESAPEAGTRVHVRLPLASGASA